MDDNELEIYRQKTLMIIHSIEKGIGNFIKTNQSSKNELIDSLNFGDLFQKFSQLQVNDKDANDIKELKILSDKLEIATIRNVCAHPVREFQAYYWFRASAFAADPKLQALEINEPYLALAACESNKLYDPPEEWIERLAVTRLLNNLPEKEPYDSTGLIGRKREVDSIIAMVMSGRDRVLNLTGPGGVGKTSLAVDVGRHLADKNRSKDKFSSIIFITFKTEYLTDQGIISKNLNTLFPNSLGNVLNETLSEIYGFSELKIDNLNERFQDENVLLILDNLEDIITNNLPEFEKIVDEIIPAHWQLIITSRITVDGAKSFPIKYLTTASMEDLSRRYYLFSLGRDIDQGTLNKIIPATAGNPMALKFIIGRLSLGEAFDEASTRMQDNILDYSFKNLIDALKPEQKIILETLFVLDRSTKDNIAEYTSLSNDEISEHLMRLFKTSLIDIDDEDGAYKIAGPVRDFLSKRPVDIKTRQQCTKKFHDRKIQQEHSSVPKIINKFSFHSSTPLPLRSMSNVTMKLWSDQGRKRFNHYLNPTQQDNIKLFSDNLDKNENAFKKYPDFFRLKAITKVLVSDLNSAYALSKLAYELDKKWIVNALFFAEMCIEQHKYDDAVEVLKPFYLDIIKNLKNPNFLNVDFHVAFIREFIAAFFKSHIWQMKYSEIMEFTENWKSIPEVIQGTFAFARAQSIRRAAEELRLYIDKKGQFAEALFLLQFCVNEADFKSRSVENELTKLHHEFNYCSEFAVNSEYFDEIENRKSEINKMLLSLNVGLKINSNEINLLNTVPVDLTNKETKQIQTRVEIISKGEGFAFARDNTKSYFIPYSNFVNKGTVFLTIGQIVEVWDISDAPSSNGAFRVGHAKY